MSKTRKTRPFFVKVAELKPHEKQVIHVSSCDGSCGVENMTAQEYKRFTAGTKPWFTCGVFASWEVTKVQKLYEQGTRGKWGVKLYNRRERASVRTKLAKMASDPESDEPEPYRGRNRNKWDME